MRVQERLLGDLTAQKGGLLRGEEVGHTVRLLDPISLLVIFSRMEDPAPEQIELGPTIHASFNELESIHMAL